MKVNYDKKNNVASLDFVDREGAYIQESVEIPGTELILDFDKDGQLVGIESLNPKEELPEELLSL